MHEIGDIGVVSHVIQLAVAPVFLLSAIAAMLTVLTNRLGRIIDRARDLEDKLEHTPAEMVAALHTELATLARRSKHINLAITLCTITALLVCTVIAILFLGNFFQFDFAIPIALFFIVAMLFLVMAFLVLLREVFIATANLRIGPH
ncbi:MAG TPA: DUF2721 domain-containing protein [Nitrospirota bacterium]|nr:DUF2721 domain-containing protein [Nitrospirota bacterium]